MEIEGRNLMKTMKITTFKTTSILAAALTFGVIAVITDGSPKAVAAEPVISTPSSVVVAARNVSTYEEDRDLTNNCVEAGFSKNECLCVVKVTKFETSLDDYRALVANYTQPQKLMTPASVTTKPAFSSQRRRADMLRLIESPNFEYRCADAHHYFETKQTP